jgi:SAM-dependent methyltransferase
MVPPLRNKAFDLVWCSGVLHHTPDPAAGHATLSRLVAPGGTFYVFVYAKRFNPFGFVRTIFNALRVTRLPEPALLVCCRLISYPSVALLQVYRALRRLPGLRPTSPRAMRTVRTRGLREIQMTWFDALSPEYNSLHTEDEVTGWFRSAGFEGITPNVEPKVGIRGSAPSAELTSGPE